MTQELIDLGTSQMDVFGGTISEPVNMPSSIENPQVDLNDPATYDLFTGGATSESGVRVNETKALTHPAVWQAVTMISGDVASLPLEVFRKEPDGDRLKMEDDPLYDLVYWQANDEMTAFRFWKRMIAWRLLWNNSYAHIQRRGTGQAASLVPLLPDRTAPERIDGDLYVVTEVAGELVPLPMEDIFHLEGLGVDNLAGFKFVQAARDAIGLGLAEIGFASKFYKNGGRVGGILELPSSMSKSGRDKVETGFSKRYSSGEAFQTIVLRENAKFHAAQVSPEQAQVVDARKESVRDIARYFNVRPGKLGEESRSSFSSKAEDNRDHHDTTLRPHLRDITQEARSKLLTQQQKRSRMYFVHDSSELLKMDFKSMAESVSILRSAEVMNGDEARAMFNMNKREDGKGGEYRNPNINTTDDTTETETTTAEPNEPAAKAFRGLLAATVNRMAGIVANRGSRKAGDSKAFLDWIDNHYDEQRESITDAVSEVVCAASSVLEIDQDQCVTTTVDSFMSESLQIIQTVVNSTHADDLKTVVEANLTEWADEAGQRYASHIFDKPQTE